MNDWLIVVKKWYNEIAEVDQAVVPIFSDFKDEQ